MSPSVPADTPELTQAAAALARWREHAPVGARIPETLWSQAVALAATHGLSQVTVTLRLDYTRLKRRVAAAGAARLCRPDPGPAGPHARLHPGAVAPRRPLPAPGMAAAPRQ